MSSGATPLALRSAATRARPCPARRCRAATDAAMVASLAYPAATPRRNGSFEAAAAGGLGAAAPGGPSALSFEAPGGAPVAPRLDGGPGVGPRAARVRREHGP